MQLSGVSLSTSHAIEGEALAEFVADDEEDGQREVEETEEAAARVGPLRWLRRRGGQSEHLHWLYRAYSTATEFLTRRLQR